MAYSYTQYVGDGVTTLFNVPFPYINPAHVHVYLDGVETGFTWHTNQTVSLAAAPAEGVVVRIRRTTPVDKPVAEYKDASVLSMSDLNATSTQNLYAIQEYLDSGQDLMATVEDGTWDAKSRRIKAVADPVNDQDVVTKAWALTVPNTALADSLAAKTAAESAASQAQASAQTALDSLAGLETKLVPLESDISTLETGLMSLAMKQAAQAGDQDRSILMNGWLDPLTDSSQAALTVMGFQTKDTGYIESLKGGTGVALEADVAGDTGNTDVVNGGVEIPAPGAADAYYVFQLPAVNVVNVTALKASLATATVPANSRLHCAVSFDGGTIWNRYDPTTKWTAVAYRNGTTWYYRTGSGSQDWTASPVNTLQGALLCAMSVESNRWGVLPGSYVQTTTNILTGGTATASHTDAGAPGYLMDGNLATYWRSPYVGNCLPVWLKYQLAAAKRTWKYRLYMSTDQYPAGYTPHAWTLEGSNDNANWTTLDTQSGQTWSAAGWKEYVIPEANRGSYLYYRLYITAGGVESANYMWLYEWQMYEEASAVSCLTSVTQAQWHDVSGEQLGFRPGVTSSVQVAGAMLKTSTSGSPRLSALSFTVDRTAADGAAEFDAFEALDPDIGRAVFVMQAVDSITLDTDVKAWMKRGAGAYVQAPLVLDSAYDATRILVRGELDMSATPGTTTQLKLTTHNNKAVRIFQAANYFKSK